MVGFRAEFGSSAGETLDVGDGKGPEVLLLCRGWMGMNSVVFFMEWGSSGMSTAIGRLSLLCAGGRQDWDLHA